MLGLSFIGLAYWASVRLLLELHHLTVILGSNIREERLAHPGVVKNTLVGNNRETIACQDKWVDEDDSRRSNSVQDNTLAQGLTMVDTEL